MTYRQALANLDEAINVLQEAAEDEHIELHDELIELLDAVQSTITDIQLMREFI